MFEININSNVITINGSIIMSNCDKVQKQCLQYINNINDTIVKLNLSNLISADTSCLALLINIIETSKKLNKSLLITYDKKGTIKSLSNLYKLDKLFKE